MVTVIVIALVGCGNGNGNGGIGGGRNNLDGTWVADRGVHGGNTLRFTGNIVEFWHSYDYEDYGMELSISGSFSVTDHEIVMLFEDGWNWASDFRRVDNTIIIDGIRFTRQ